MLYFSSMGSGKLRFRSTLLLQAATQQAECSKGSSQPVGDPAAAYNALGICCNAPLAAAKKENPHSDPVLLHPVLPVLQPLLLLVPLRNSRVAALLLCEAIWVHAGHEVQVHLLHDTQRQRLTRLEPGTQPLCQLS